MGSIELKTCEFLTTHRLCSSGDDIMRAMRKACPVPHKVTNRYEGMGDVLMVWGAGNAEIDKAIQQQLGRGRRVVSWDHGYFRRAKHGGYLRVSIDDWHPQRWIEKTIPDPARWGGLNIRLQEVGAENGHIILVGMGPKSHKFLKSDAWESSKLMQLRQRFPGRRIVFRPKVGRPFTPLQCETVADGPIEDLLRGAALVVCRHSNVAVDAAVVGVPFECEDGAAVWLRDRPFTRENRLDFLRRLACWQYLPAEATAAWRHIRRFL